jgi:uncharacterized protein (DUF1697 family)
MTSFVAFQLGINVGKRQVKMAFLKDVLENAGFKNVRTILASGNVVFEADEIDPTKLTLNLNVLLTASFGFEIKNIVRTIDEIQKLVNSDPFKEIAVTPATRLYITFLTEPVNSNVHIQYESEDKDFRILRATEREVVSVKTLTEKSGTTDAMQILTKLYGKNITTRNWNTILKIAVIA